LKFEGGKNRERKPYKEIAKLKPDIRKDYINTVLTVKQLAEKYQISQSTIRNYVRDIPQEDRPRGAKIYKKVSDGERESIRADYLNTRGSTRWIGKRHGRSSQLVCGIISDLVTQDQREGFFYMIRPLPDLAPDRIKFGYAKDIEARLNKYRTICPTAELVESWPINRKDEFCLLGEIREHFNPVNPNLSIGCEVFDINDTLETINMINNWLEGR
jgi:hypothetical protein